MGEGPPVSTPPHVRAVVRFVVDDRALLALHRRAFGATGTGTVSWSSRLERHALTWVGAFDDEELVGFVQVCWDGGSHAFVLDTVVDPRWQRRGVGRLVVEAAVAEARRAGCEWVHVDFAPHLAPFYLDACGFRPTGAGVRRVAE